MSIITGAFAQLVLTWTDVAVNTETVTIGDKVYTFQDTLTDVDGNVHIGADAEECIDNLVAAVNLDPTLGESYSPGTGYAAAMTKNKSQRGTKSAADEFTAICKVPGVVGNTSPVAETLTNASWAGAATALAGGTGDSDYQEVEDYSASIRNAMPFSVGAGVLMMLNDLEAELAAATGAGA